jgi:prepilin-type N-terminal cleavage/methylation domain-containing protein
VTTRERGFSLVELLVASTIIAVGFAGLAGMVALTSYAVREGRHRSVAVALADERAEQLQAARWDGAGDCLGLSPASAFPPVTDDCPPHGAGFAPFPDERAGALPPPFEQFSRTARVLPCAAGICAVTSADLRLVTVTVSYTPTSGVGANASGVDQSVAVNRLVGRRR